MSSTDYRGAVFRTSEIFFIALYIAPTVLALGDILRITTDIWAESKQNQALWTVIVLILPIVGPALYFFIARPKLIDIRG